MSDTDASPLRQPRQKEAQREGLRDQNSKLEGVLR